MKPSIGRDVCLKHHELSLQRDILEEVQEKRLSASISTNDESHKCPITFDLIQVLNHGVDFFQSANLDVV